jgi:phage baseplate assembly protein V
MRLLNSIKMHASSMDQSQPVARWGVVQSVDAASMTAKVMLQPEGVLTDWLPIASSMVGSGWGLVHAPAAGTQVVCLPDGGDHESYVIIGATWSTAARAPASAEGEFWLVHSTGSKIALTNDGHVTVTDAGGCSLAFTNNGTATLAGTLHVTGNIVAGYGGGDQVGLQSHIHAEHGTGGGTTSPATAGT